MDVILTLLLYLVFCCTCSGEHHQDCKSPQFLELGKTGNIRCSFEDGFFAVFWYNSSDVGGIPIVTLKDNLKGGAGLISGDFDIQSDGSLIINNTTLNDEKTFSVVVFNSTLQTPVSYSVRVIIFVPPSPRYLVVHGCEDQQYCVLQTQAGDVIKCTAYGIRPKVTLEFRILYGTEEFQTFFSDGNSTVRNTGKTFDISLTSEFHATWKSEKRITIECIVTGPMAALFPLSSQFDLHFVYETSAHKTTQSGNVPLIVLLTGGVLFLICFFLLLLLFRARRHNSRHAGENSDQQNLKYIPENLLHKVGNKQKVFDLWKERFEDIEKRYLVTDSSFLNDTVEKQDINIVIIGKSGVGKSATANSIFGNRVFAESMAATSVTRESAYATRNLQNRFVSIVDTPGLLDSNYPQKSLVSEVSKIAQTYPKGVDAFVLILNIGFSDFNEELKTYKSVEMTFGGSFKNYCALVFTHADSMEVSLDQFLKEQKGSESFSDFIKEFGRNVVAVNNKSRVPAERMRNKQVILSMIDSVKVKNEHPFKIIANMEGLSKQENFSGGVSSVDEIMSVNPESHRSREGALPKIMDPLDDESSKNDITDDENTTLCKVAKKSKGGATYHPVPAAAVPTEDDQSEDELAKEVNALYNEHDKMLENLQNSLTSS